MIEHATLPLLPEFGRSETYYSKMLQKAEAEDNLVARAAAKVGQYVSLALDTSVDWPTRAKYFQHALEHHCQPPMDADAEVERFYAEMAQAVRFRAGQEALRLASAEDDMYAARLGLGNDRSSIEAEAETFFGNLLSPGGEHCPLWFHPDDWAQLKLIREQWI